jgi:hypothetical protein
MEVSGQLRVPAALPQGKSPRYPLDRRLPNLIQIRNRPEGLIREMCCNDKMSVADERS